MIALRPDVISRFMLPLAWCVALAGAGYATAVLLTRHVGGDAVEYSLKPHENDPRVVASRILNVQAFRLADPVAIVQEKPLDDEAPMQVPPLPKLQLAGVMTGIDNAPGFALLGVNEQPVQLVRLNDQPLPDLLIVALHPAGVDVLWHDRLHHVPVVFSSATQAPPPSLPSPRATPRPVRR